MGFGVLNMLISPVEAIVLIIAKNSFMGIWEQASLKI